MWQINGLDHCNVHSTVELEWNTDTSTSGYLSVSTNQQSIIIASVAIIVSPGSRPMETRISIHRGLPF